MADEYIIVDQSGTQQRVGGARTSQNLYAGMIDHRSDDLIKWILDARKRIDESIFELAGLEFDRKVNKWVSRDGYMIMNEQCVNYLRGVLKMAVSPEMIMTRYEDDEEMRKMGEPLCAQLIIDLSLNRGRYGIESTKLPVIINSIQNIIKATYKRGYMQGERKWLMHQASYETKQIEQPKKTGFITGLFGGIKK